MWWKDGLRFGCTACGRCCTRRLPAASSPLAEKEIRSMARVIGVSSTRFKAEYTELLPSETDPVRRLGVDESGKCRLLTSSGKCSVYKARPAGCQTYPFWPENVASPYEWAREAMMCEGIGSPWAQTLAESADKPAPPEVGTEEIEINLLIEELRRAGTLSEQNWTYPEAAEHLESLRESGMDELALEPWPVPRRALYHEGGLVVLETTEVGNFGAEERDEKLKPTTEHQASNVVGEQGVVDFKEDLSWVTRSLHFESSIGVVQTEVRYHPEEQRFDHSCLGFGVHQSFLQLLREASLSLKLPSAHSETTVAVLGGGGGALPMALHHVSARDHATHGPLAAICKIVVVEKDQHVADLAYRFFGFQDSAEFQSPALPRIELRVEDALAFFAPEGDPGQSESQEEETQQPKDSIAAVFVDIAGAALPESSSSDAGLMLTPPPAFLSGSFVKAALSAVLPLHGVVAWNVLVSSVNESAALESAADAIAAAIGDDLTSSGRISVSVLGPMRRTGGCSQWLLIASAGARNLLGSLPIEPAASRDPSKIDTE
ncbi:unnamed protein product [Polarella glacialis]|uniref:Uncharacterized protein n=1 Tax=Polarella glacialis TaxID=89957 RepID=A0A813FFQ9_POLGL|nr:unnamed protein product [Polarella glacialis]CAE8743319.1 unnamed protein product [Polarella glacialis]